MGDVVLALENVRDEADATKTFGFAAEGLAGAVAGQYLIVRLDVPADPRRGSRSFTMANAPGERPVLVTTRIRTQSPFKQALAALPRGGQTAAKGPFGTFTLHPGTAPALFLAGGIGVTPFRSMVKDALDTGRTIPMTLLTSDRTPGAIPFRETMEAWARDHPTFCVDRTVTQADAAGPRWSGRVGRIDGPWIRAHLEDPEATVAYAAGPPAFVAGMRDALHAIGFPDERIRVEQFIGY